MRLSLQPALPVALLVLFLAASLAAVDSVGRAAFAGAYSRLPADFRARESGRPDQTYQNVTIALGAVAGVATVEPLIHASPNSGLYTWSSPKYFVSNLAAVNSSFFSHLKGLALEGVVPTIPGSVAVHRAVARTLGLSLGSVVFYKHSFFNVTKGAADWAFLNLTVVGLYGDSLPPREIQSMFDSWSATVDVSTYLPLSALGWALSGLRVDPTVTLLADYFVWVRGDLIDFTSVSRTELGLARVETELKDQGRPYGLFISNEVRPVLAEVNEALAQQQIAFVSTGAPLVAFSLALTFLATELSVRPRVFEFAAMKARGADDKFLARRVILNGVVSGLLGSLSGLVAGFLVGQGLARTNLVLPATASVPVVGFLVATGVATSCLSTVGPVLALRRVPLAYGLTDPRLVAEWNPTSPARLLWGAVLGSGVLTILASDVLAGTPQGLSSVGPLAVFLGPLLISAITVQTVLERVPVWQTGIARVIAPVAGATRLPFLGGMSTQPRQVRALAVVITLGLAFALLVGIAQASQLDYDRRTVEAEVGADLVLETGQYDPNLTKGLLRHPGSLSVASATSLLGSEYGVYAIDSRNFTSATFLSKEYFSAGLVGDLRTLEAGGRAAVTRSFSQRTGLVFGDLVRVGLFYTLPSQPTDIAYYDFEIAAVLTFLPGVGHPLQTSPDYMVIDFQSLPSGLRAAHLVHSGSSRYFVRVAPGFDAAAMADELSQSGVVADFFVFDEELTRLRSDPVQSGVANLLFAEALYSSVLLASGVTMVLVFAEWSRRLELGTLVARGCVWTDIFRLGLSDVLVPLLQAFIVGIPVGLLGAFVLEDLVLIPSNALIQRQMVVDLGSLVPLLGVICLTMVLSSAAAVKIARRAAIPSLRLRMVA